MKESIVVQESTRAPWVAKILGKDIYEFGLTPLEALGNLVTRHAEILGIEFHNERTKEFLTKWACPQQKGVEETSPTKLD